MKKLKHQLRKQGVSLEDYEGVPQLDFNDLKGMNQHSVHQ